MKLKSCAFTQSYKGCYIHQHTDGQFSWSDPDHGVHYVKSWRAAQLAITAYLSKRSQQQSASSEVPQQGI